MSEPENIKSVVGNGQDAGNRRPSCSSQNSQTAKEFIESQLRLEADAREVLPYSFNSCSQELGPLRQTLFACLTCNPPPATPDAPFTAAGVCYSCSIACHGEHTLVELFTKRNFVCDCGTTRIAESPCTLRSGPQTGAKGVSSEKPHAGNRYNGNFQNRFCGCGEDYNAHEEKGTMFQCLGLGTAETGGCGEDWWHPECLIGLPRDWYKKPKGCVPEDATIKEDNIDNGTKEESIGNGALNEKIENDVAEENVENDAVKEENIENAAIKEEDDEDETPLPPCFPAEDDFETFLCYKCLESNPWLKKYAGTAGFFPPVFKDGGLRQTAESAPNSNPPPSKSEDQLGDNSKKRKADDNEDGPNAESVPKRAKEESQDTTLTLTSPEPKSEPKQQKPKHDFLPKSNPRGIFSLFLKEDFRDHFCRCPDCYPSLAPHPQLREEEETYEPPMSEDGDDGGSTVLERGQAALSNVDRVRAIEGAMVYNHLRDKVKAFLTPFAESGTAVGADDIKAYFEKLRGDEQAIKDAAGKASAEGDRDDGGDGRHEQSGY
ncbi:putative metaphase-anaphase transition protein [Aspergillus californicus]